MRQENTKPEIFFREMLPADALAVEMVERASFSVPWSRESFWREAKNEMTAYRLAVSPSEGEKGGAAEEKIPAEGRIVGYAGCWIIGDEAQIMNVAIHPDYRGYGVGGRLLKDLMDTAKSRGAKRMTLEVRPTNKAALALYKSFGFVDCGRRPHYYEDGEDAVIMWRFDL